MKTVFEPGDVVYLRSGSLPMTITALSDDNKTANVRWFEDGTSYKDAIPVAALVSAEQIEADRGVGEFNETPKKKKKKKK